MAKIESTTAIDADLAKPLVNLVREGVNQADNREVYLIAYESPGFVLEVHRNQETAFILFEFAVDRITVGTGANETRTVLNTTDLARGELARLSGGDR